MWVIVSNALGARQLLPIDVPIPEGWTSEGTTGDPYALTAAAALPPPTRIVTRLAFRRRFTLTERIAFDSAPENAALSAEARAAVRTMQTDVAMAEEIDLDDPDVVTGIGMLAAIGIIAEGRVAEILA